MTDSRQSEEIERRLGRSFERVRAQLVEHFGREWDEVLVVIETSAMKTGRTHAEVIVELVRRFERKPAPQQRLKRSLVRWIGKPWRERENPWDRFKHRVPPPPPPTDLDAGDDLDVWTPLKPEED